MSPSQMSDPLGASPLDSLTPASLTFPPPRTGAGMEMEMTMGARRGSRKGREAMVERRHGGVGPLEELWHPEQLTKDVAGKSLVGGTLLERVGSAALLYLRVASTPYMGGLLCAPSGEVGRRGNFCMLCILCFSSSSSSLQSTPQTCCPHQRSNIRLARGCAPRSVRSCVAHFYSAGDRYWHGNGGSALLLQRS